MNRRFAWLWLFVLLGVLFFHFGPYWISTWYSKWFFLLCSASLLMGLWVGSVLSFWLVPAFSYLLLSATYFGAFGQTEYASSMATAVYVSLGKNALYAGIVVTAIGLIWVHFKRSWAIPISLGFAAICMSSTVATLILGHAARDNGYFSGNASMNGALIAALLPFMWIGRKDILGQACTLLACIAIYFTHANVPLGTLFVVSVCYLAAKHRAVDFLLPSAIIGAISAFAGWYYLGVKFMNDDGRFEMWRLAMKVWHNHWFGQGIGSGLVFFPLEQLAANQTNYGLFLWLHCEPLQTLYELGIVGTSCIAIAWVYTTVRAFRIPQVFAAFMGFSAMSVFDYPCRLPIHALCWTLVAGMALLPINEGLPSGRRLL